eukprot:5901597-Alexandrium_andersonii.AAC.1
MANSAGSVERAGDLRIGEAGRALPRLVHLRGDVVQPALNAHPAVEAQHWQLPRSPRNALDAVAEGARSGLELARE